MPSWKRLVAGVAGALALTVPAPAATASPEADAALGRALARAMGSSGPYSGAFVFNASEGRTVLRYRQHRARVLASNVKLFTTAAALAQVRRRGHARRPRSGGSAATSPTASGAATSTSAAAATPPSAARPSCAAPIGSGATVQALAAKLDAAGIQRVSGRIFGDESRFDALRGGPDSRFRTSIWVGPLSALAYNRGLASESGRSFQTNPPRFAAGRLRRGARGARHPRRPCGERQGHARSGPHARRRRVSADVAPGPPDQQAIRQLLRRDAAEGPGELDRRPRHHLTRRPHRSRLRAQARRERPAGGRLRPRPRQPRLALPRNPPAALDAQPRRIRRPSAPPWQ